MNKLLIAVLLAVLSTSVLAEWTDVGSSDNSTGYADFSTIRKSGNKVKMWYLVDHKVVKIFKGDGTRFLSSVTFTEYDCKEETQRQLTFSWYSKNMGQGDIVYMSGNLHAEFEPITPGSIDNTLFKVACGK
jgi:hypothetical protein